MMTFQLLLSWMNGVNLISLRKLPHEGNYDVLLLIVSSIISTE